MENTQRYWDGGKWTDDVAPLPPKVPEKKGISGGAVVAISVVLMLLVVGFLAVQSSQQRDQRACEAANESYQRLTGELSADEC